MPPGATEEKEEEERPDILYPYNLDEVIDFSLDERHQIAIRSRYEQGMTYREIGDLLGVGQERVHQILVKALQVLREPCNYLRLNAVPQIEVVKLRNEPRTLTEQHEDLKQQVADLFGDLERRKAEKRLCLPRESPLDKLGLSVRSYNALIAAGISTVGELIVCPVSKLKKTRHLGATSVEDIRACLERFDYELN